MHKLITTTLIFTMLLLMSPAATLAQCGPEEYCSRSTSSQSCSSIGGRPVTSCEIYPGYNGTCCRPRDTDGGVLDFDELETQTTPRFLGGFTNMSTFVTILLPYVFSFAGMLLLIYIIVSGYQLMLSRGDPRRNAKAKKNLTYAIAGFVIVLVSYWFVQVVGQTLGLEAITETFSGN